MKKLIITKIDDNCWKVEGKGIWILTDTEEKAKEWKKYYEKI